jgi:hypothetical protein
MLGLILLVGCQSVTSTAMIGDKSEKVAQAVQGVWKFNDAVFYAKATGNGRVDLSTVQWKDDKWQLQAFTLYATTLGDQAYLNVLPVENNANQPTAKPSDKKAKEAPAPTYAILQLLYDVDSGAKSVDSLVVLMPRLQAFETAVTQGKLAGKLNGKSEGKPASNVHLTASAQVLNAFIQAAGQKLFDEAHPQVLTRLATISQDDD